MQTTHSHPKVLGISVPFFPFRSCSFITTNSCLGVLPKWPLSELTWFLSDTGYIRAMLGLAHATKTWLGFTAIYINSVHQF